MDFVRIVADEVIRVETMKVGGQKIVRVDKEVILEKPDKDTEAKQEDRPANAPSLRRPGEDSENAPKPSDGISPVPITAPPDTQQPPGNPGPGDIVAGRAGEGDLQNPVLGGVRAYFSATVEPTSANENASETFGYSWPSTST